MAQNSTADRPHVSKDRLPLSTGPLQRGHRYRQPGRSSSLSIFRKDHYAASLNNLALLYSKMGNYTAAEPLFNQAIEIGRTVFGEDPPTICQGLQQPGRTIFEDGNHTAAEPFVHRSNKFD
jgi:tetratricopeptide (TPR) repeat protein